MDATETSTFPLKVTALPPPTREGTNAYVPTTVERLAPSGLLKPQQAAEYLQIAKATLAVWRSTNRQKLAFVKIGGQVRYRKEDLDRFIADAMRNDQTA